MYFSGFFSITDDTAYITVWLSCPVYFFFSARRLDKFMAVVVDICPGGVCNFNKNFAIT